MTAATEASIDAAEQDREANRLNEAIRYFLKRYEPEERRDQLDFEMNLHNIVRLIYAEAQRPFLKTMSASYAAMPFPPMIIPKTK